MDMCVSFFYILDSFKLEDRLYLTFHIPSYMTNWLYKASLIFTISSLEMLHNIYFVEYKPQAEDNLVCLYSRWLMTLQDSGLL